MGHLVLGSYSIPNICVLDHGESCTSWCQVNEACFFCQNYWTLFSSVGIGLHQQVCKCDRTWTRHCLFFSHCNRIWTRHCLFFSHCNRIWTRHCLFFSHCNRIWTRHCLFFSHCNFVAFRHWMLELLWFRCLKTVTFINIHNLTRNFVLHYTFPFQQGLRSFDWWRVGRVKRSKYQKNWGQVVRACWDVVGRDVALTWWGCVGKSLLTVEIIQIIVLQLMPLLMLL